MYFDRIPNSRLRRVNELMNKPPLFTSRVNYHVIQEHLNKSPWVLVSCPVSLGKWLPSSRAWLASCKGDASTWELRGSIAQRYKSGLKSQAGIETLALLFTGCVTLGKFHTFSNPWLLFPLHLLCHHCHLCHHHDKSVSIFCTRLRATHFLPIISFNPHKKLRRLVLLLPYVTNEETGTEVA